MLKYEEKLHLDEHYSKLQNGNFTTTIITLLWCVFCYFGVYYLVRKYGGSIPDIYSWNRAPFWRNVQGIDITYADAIYIILGLLLMCYGSIKLSIITRKNHSVRNRDSDTPDRLLTEGCYANVRHPMYGIFVVMYSSIFIAFHSVMGVVIILVLYVLQIINAISEERRTLIPVFGEEYLAYKSKVHNLIFSIGQTMIWSFLVLITIIGLLF